MSRTFNDSLATDLETVFLNTNEFAETVTIKRGAISTTGVAVLVAARMYEVIGDNGVPTSIAMTDFDLAASSYAVNATQVDPKKGDRIVTADGTIYEVRAAGDTSPWFEPVGSGNDMIRVHTQRVSR